MSQQEQALAFRHEALLYSGWAGFIAGTVPFIRGGLEAGEPVLVVESPEKVQLLRTALDRDADRVMFADMANVGANPARIIPAWQDFVAMHGATGTRLRGIGEPIWQGRSDDELVECQRHESLLNVAFGRGRPWWLLCPYDTDRLDASVIDEARRSHEYLSQDGVAWGSSEFRGIDGSGAPFDAPLPAPDTSVRGLAFDRRALADLRRVVGEQAMDAGLESKRASDLVVAANEVATNSILHGGGGGTLLVWRDSEKLVCEVSDSGRYGLLPLADRERPVDGDSPRGLWLANQLCDLVQIRTFSDRTVMRLHMRIDPRHRLHVFPSDSATASSAGT
ncbi:MAG TPA: sensor histidine kinase [Candidatus Dormibacteraeota bacterium]|nr:sensor histidine kinase [Candidatus Dormibacteraeota bacterium]